MREALINMKYSAYWRLMRFHQPVGIVLLWCPTAWALWAANHGAPSIGLLLIFLLGTIIMRAAGCVVNDMADRNIDKRVLRTQNRPLAQGEISFKHALILLFFLLTLAACLLLLLPVACVSFALFALVITLIYPFCKRYIQAPQLVLGVAFSMGIPMAYSASHARFDASFYILFLLNALWIVYYDTAYAMADKPDDLKIGVKSTAIWFGAWDLRIMMMLMLVISLMWLVFMHIMALSHYFYLFWLASLVMFVFQYGLIKNRERAPCFSAFKANALYGLWMWLGVALCST